MDEELLYQIIGSRIKMARAKCEPRLSQAQLAAKLHISRASMVNIESGRQRLPIHLLWRIAEILDTEPSQLLPRRDEIERPADQLGMEEAAKIEANASGNQETARHLAAFVSRARKAT